MEKLAIAMLETHFSKEALSQWIDLSNVVLVVVCLLKRNVPSRRLLSLFSIAGVIIVICLRILLCFVVFCCVLLCFGLFVGLFVCLIVWLPFKNEKIKLRRMLWSGSLTRCMSICAALKISTAAASTQRGAY